MSSANDSQRWYTFYSESERREYFYDPASQTTTWVLPDGVRRSAAAKKTFLGTNPGYTPPRIRRTTKMPSSTAYVEEETEETAATSSPVEKSRFLLVAFLCITISVVFLIFRFDNLRDVIGPFLPSISHDEGISGALSQLESSQNKKGGSTNHREEIDVTTVELPRVVPANETKEPKMSSSDSIPETVPIVVEEEPLHKRNEEKMIEEKDVSDGDDVSVEGAAHVDESIPSSPEEIISDLEPSSVESAAKEEPLTTDDILDAIDSDDDDESIPSHPKVSESLPSAMIDEPMEEPERVKDEEDDFLSVELTDTEASKLMDELTSVFQAGKDLMDKIAEDAERAGITIEARE